MNLFHILSTISSVGLFVWLFLWIGFKLARYVGTHPEGKKQALSNIIDAPGKFSKRLDDETKELRRKRALELEQKPNLDPVKEWEKERERAREREREKEQFDPMWDIPF